MKLHVECRAGPLGDPEPSAFMLGDSRVEVLQIVDRWFGPDYTYFKLIGQDQSTYILRCTLPALEWELTMFQSSLGAPPF